MSRLVGGVLACQPSGERTPTLTAVNGAGPRAISVGATLGSGQTGTVNGKGVACSVQSISSKI